MMVRYVIVGFTAEMKPILWDLGPGSWEMAHRLLYNILANGGRGSIRIECC